MSRQDLYFRLPVALQNAALTAYGAMLRRRRYGGVFPSEYRQAIERLGMTAVEVHQWREARLRETLTRARASVPFYAAQKLPVPTSSLSATEALTCWPRLSKAEVQAAGERMVDERVDRKSIVEIHTGGTTGRALAVFATPAVLQRNYAYFERFKYSIGISLTDRVATMAGRPIVEPTRNRPPYWRTNYAARQLLLSSYHLSPDSYSTYLGALRSFGPALIDAYPSSIEPLARHALRTNELGVRPRAVITSSETLNSEVRALIERAFCCPVFDHYGSAEMVALITQCSHGRYHANEDFGFLEILNAAGNPVAPGEFGEIVATGFINDTMPLIRYRMGDSASWAAEPCSCGSSMRTLESIAGRMDDVVVTPDGRRVGRLDPIFKAVSDLREARIVQTALDEVRLELVADADFSAQAEADLVTELAVRLGPTVKIHTVRVRELPRTAGGKLRMVVSPFARESA